MTSAAYRRARARRTITSLAWFMSGSLLGIGVSHLTARAGTGVELVWTGENGKTASTFAPYPDDRTARLSQVRFR